MHLELANLGISIANRSIANLKFDRLIFFLKILINNLRFNAVILHIWTEQTN